MSEAEKLVWEVLWSPPERMTNSIRWFIAGLATVPFNGVHEGGFFATDIRPRATAQLDIKLESVPHHLRAQEATRAWLRHSDGQPVLSFRVLPADIEVPLSAPGGQSGNGHGLDHGKRIGFHEDAVLKRPRF
jgi:hypothetical protein